MKIEMTKEEEKIELGDLVQDKKNKDKKYLVIYNDEVVDLPYSILNLNTMRIDLCYSNIEVMEKDVILVAKAKDLVLKIK